MLSPIWEPSLQLVLRSELLEMMHGAPMFPPGGIPFGGFWVLLLPVLVIAAVLIFRVVSAHDRRERRERRKMRRMSLQDHILQLAFRKGGLLTVTDVVAETGFSFEKVEKTLNGMVDFARVNMVVRDSGIVVYEFAEILHRDLGTTKTSMERGL